MRARAVMSTACALFLCVPLTAAGPRGPSDAVLDALTQELARSAQALGKQSPAAYFIAYEAWDQSMVSVYAEDGAALLPDTSRWRRMVADVRVGDYALDSTHPIQGPLAGLYRLGGGAQSLPLEDDPWALRAAVWQETERRFRQAGQRYTQAVANRAATAAPSDTSADFSREAAYVRVDDPPAMPVVDAAVWRDRLARVSDRLANAPGVFNSSARLSVERDVRWLVNSEGTRVRTGRTHVRVFLTAATRGPDGAEMHLYRSFDSHAGAGLPSEERLLATADSLTGDLAALRTAPEAEPYAGPAIMGGEAAAVFFHEIFGHRVEGHRQKDENFAQTFTARMGQQVLPAWMSIVDDPTLASYGGVELNGQYSVDDEGVAARRTPVVTDGKLVGFLMGRSPVKAAANSNGHGRRQPGTPLVVSRQGNLIVTSSRAVTPAELRRQLVAEVKRQGKPYGLYFEQVEGGFTMTGRYGPQAFKVLPLKVWRVYADGRPDQLVRGADVEGTPLTAFASILAADNDLRVFNGYCGAESGSVPVSAASPAVLLAQIEVSKKTKPMDRPPVLAAPRMPAPPSLAAPGAAGEDPLSRALGDELKREADSLALPGLPRPYLIRYRVSDARGVNASASFGALVSSRSGRSRTVTAEVRVGSTQEDNGNFNDPFSFAQTSETLPLNEEYAATREAAWRITDAAYRGAVEAIARKRAARANEPADTMPDYSAAAPLVLILPPAAAPPDTGAVNDLVRRASAVFRDFPAIDASSVNFGASGVNNYVLASDGTRTRWPGGRSTVTLSATTHTADGHTLTEARRIDSPPATLPDTTPVMAAARALAASLTARATAAAVERYRGPIILEPEAAARLFADLLGRRLSGTPQATLAPQFAAMRTLRAPSAALGERVLPAGFDVVDDPLRESAGGVPLAGHYAVDDEGVRGQPVRVVEDGVVRALLASRTPGPAAATSNGHGRGSMGSMGGPGARGAMATLWVTPRRALSGAELRKALLARAATAGLDHAIVVRALTAQPRRSPFDAGGTFQMSSVSGASEGAAFSAVAVMVYRDGRELPLPDLVLSGLTPRTLERILGAGDRPAATNVAVSVGDGPGALSLLGMDVPDPYAVGGSIVTPAILVDDIEASQPRPTDRPPLLKHPFFDRR